MHVKGICCQWHVTFICKYIVMVVEECRCRLSACVCNQCVLVKCCKAFKVFLCERKSRVGSKKWEENSGRHSEEMRIWLLGESGDVYGWGHDGESERRGRRVMFTGWGGSEASKLLVKWKWLFSRIQDTWALRWINVSDLLSESLSERKRGRGGGGGVGGRTERS